MAWKIQFSEYATKQFKKLNKSIAKDLIDYLKNKVIKLQDPRSLGRALGGNKSGFWRYRKGDYRLICEINDEEITIWVLRIGHRKEVYD